MIHLLWDKNVIVSKSRWDETETSAVGGCFQMNIKEEQLERNDSGVLGEDPVVSYSSNPRECNPR